jgi:hypothetical protein
VSRSAITRARLIHICCPFTGDGNRNAWQGIGLSFIPEGCKGRSPRCRRRQVLVTQEMPVSTAGGSQFGRLREASRSVWVQPEFNGDPE